jgi:hypothetical protein
LKLRFYGCNAKNPIQARSASEGKAVPRWRFGLVGKGASAPWFQLWTFGLDQKSQLQNWRFGLVWMVLPHLSFNCGTLGLSHKRNFKTFERRFLLGVSVRAWLLRGSVLRTGYAAL